MNRRVLVIILALLLAVLGTTAVLFYVNQADARALEGQTPVDVLVAKQMIPAGTSARDAKSLLAMERMPAASVPSDALASITTDLEKRVTSSNIAPGQLLTRRLLISESAKNEVVLPAGKLAVSIGVDGGKHSSGVIEPGFKVAVFSTFTVGKGRPAYTPSGEKALTFSPAHDQATRLLLPKVEVIGVLFEKRSKTAVNGDAFGKYIVTVAVSQKEAEKLIHALNTSIVSVAHVNGASKVAPSKGTDTYHLFGNEG